MRSVCSYLDVLQKLISFDTTSKKSNLPMINYLQSFLTDIGFECITQESECGKKANLIATVGPKDRRGIILSGHTDVVPVDGQVWDTNPFEATIDSNKIYGRGSCDMKGFIATVLDVMRNSQLNNLKLPIGLIFTYDEEVGCGGAKNVIRKVGEYISKPPLVCLVGEPTMMNKVTCHKGIELIKTKIYGVQGHSSLQNNTLNAINIAGKVVDFLSKYIYKNNTNKSNEEMSINIGEIKGGVSVNIVAGKCIIHWEVRYFKHISKDILLSKLNDLCESIINVENNKIGYDALQINTESYANVPPLIDNSDDIFCEFNVNDSTRVSYSTEAGIFQKYWDVPTLLCGPGSIEQAHKENEYITIEQLDKSKGMIESLVSYCSAI